MRVKVEVLKAHIKKGKCGDPQQCMVALAIRKNLKQGLIAVVGSEVFDVYHLNEDGEPDYAKESVVQNASLPRSATRAITQFDDRKGKAKPVAFFVDLPENILR